MGMGKRRHECRRGRHERGQATLVHATQKARVLGQRSLSPAYAEVRAVFGSWWTAREGTDNAVHATRKARVLGQRSLSLTYGGFGRFSVRGGRHERGQATLSTRRERRASWDGEACPLPTRRFGRFSVRGGRHERTGNAVHATRKARVLGQRSLSPTYAEVRAVFGSWTAREGTDAVHAAQKARLGAAKPVPYLGVSPRVTLRKMPVQVRKEPSAPVELFLERYAAVLALVLVLIASARIAATYSVFNHTFDEPAHIACGMEWLDKGVYRWEPQHPPLARVAAALGPYLAGVRSQNTPNVDEFSFTREGLAILFHDHRYDRVLMLARLGILPFFWIACGVVYMWGRKYYGAPAAVAAVFLFSFLPPVLAHASLATTDMAFTAFLGAAFLAGMIWLEQPNLKTGMAFGAATGLAIVSKFSTFAFFPAGDTGAGVLSGCGTVRLEADLAGGAAAGGLVRSRSGGGLRGGVGGIPVFFRSARRTRGAGAGPGAFPGHQGCGGAQSARPSRLSAGAYSRFGFWYFYPVVLAVKTPIAFLLLLGAGAWLAIRKRAFGPMRVGAAGDGRGHAVDRGVQPDKHRGPARPSGVSVLFAGCGGGVVAPALEGRHAEVGPHCAAGAGGVVRRVVAD